MKKIFSFVSKLKFTCSTLFNSIFLIGIFSLISLNSFSLNYYVNDASTVGDAFSTGTGSNLNNGQSAAFPKATLTNLWATYGPLGTNVITSGDIIYIDKGTYNDVNLTLNITGITISGAGPAKTVFDNASASADANRLFDVTANNITIQGIYVKGYNRGTGGASAIQISGVTGVVFNNVLSDENRPGGGSATIVVTGASSVTFNGGGSNCNSTGSVAGGGVNVEGNGNTVIFNDYSFSNNSKDFQGGSGLYVVGNNTTNVTVNNSILADNRNTSASGGGAIFVSGSNLTINGTCFSNNSSFQGGGPNYGGAISVGRGATVNITNCTFTNNSVTNSGNGGAIAINTSFAGSGTTATVNLTTCTFTGNTSTSSGNHLYARVGSSNAATFNINECTFSSSGQDIRNANTATINLQNSGNPSKTGTVNTINTTAPVTSAVTSCPVLQGSCYGVILPVEFIDFSGSCEKTHAKLEWSTASEHNNDFFTIERAGSNAVFYELTQVEGALNTTQKTDYVFADYYAEEGLNYYRLSQTDVNGASRELKTISVNNNCLTGSGLDLSSSYNSTNNSINLGYKFDHNQVLEATVYNAMGQLVQTSEIFLKASDRFTEINLMNSFSNGIYFLKLSNSSILFSDKIMISK
jgi:hypothetical protein